MFSRWTAVSSLFVALAVLCGAFGAHGLKEVLDAYGREVYDKAALYHLTHALGMLAVSIGGAASAIRERCAHLVLCMLSAGIVLFSGSLYVLAISGIRWLGMVTPFGGTLFILAWTVLAVDQWRASAR